MLEKKVGQDRAHIAAFFLLKIVNTSFPGILTYKEISGRDFSG